MRKLLICWMVATTAHLPCPMFDGDTFGSHSPNRESAMAGWLLIDIDLVLLGCGAPDDTDDGPVDDDRDPDDESGPFPIYVRSLSDSTGAPAGWISTRFASSRPCEHSVAGCVGAPLFSSEILPLYFAVTGGGAVMRC